MVRFRPISILSVLGLSLLALLSVSCVHQFPEPLETRIVTINIRHQLPWDLFEWTRTTRSTQSMDPSALTARYIVGVYPEGCNTDIPVSKSIVYQSDIERNDFQIDIELPVGRWDLRIWSDNVGSDSRISPYYDPSDFGAITYATPFLGNDKYKDAFVGKLTVDIPSSRNQDWGVSVFEAELRRPLTAFAFIATDLKDFIDQELTRTRERALSKELPPSLAPPFTLDDYVAHISYSGFLPSVYHHFTDKPIDSTTGAGFNAVPDALNDSESLLGHDFVFINGSESTVRVQLDLYHKDGTHIARVNSFDIPVKRNRCTVVRGEFLTSKASGTTGINPDFDGEFNIEYK